MNLDSSVIETRLSTARQCFDSGEVEKAAALVGQVANQVKGNTAALLKCAQSYTYCFEVHRAEELLQSILPTATPQVRALSATLYPGIGRPEKAVHVLEELRKNNQLSLPHLAQLAKYYEQSNRQPQAIAALKECVEHAPTQPQPRVLLARLYRQTGNLADAERLLTEVVADSPPIATLVHAWTELSLVFDQAQNHERAVTSIEEAKNLLRNMPQVQQKAQRATEINLAFHQLYEHLDRDILTTWLSEPLESLPVAGAVQLMGFPRSGTTLLEQMLDAHDQIYAAPERTFFARSIFPWVYRRRGLSVESLQVCSVRQLNELRQRYIQWHTAFAGKDLSDRYLVDKNPNHTSLAIGLLRVLPESKIVFALRDPRDVIVSAYMRFFALSEFSASYLTLKSTCELYAHEMNVWLRLKALLPDNWVEVKYEDTVSDPKGVTNKLSSFLGVEWQAEMLEYRNNASKFVNSPTHAEVRRPLHQTSVGRWRHYETQLKPHLPLLAPFLEAFGYD